MHVNFAIFCSDLLVTSFFTYDGNCVGKYKFVADSEVWSTIYFLKEKTVIRLLVNIISAGAQHDAFFLPLNVLGLLSCFISKLVKYIVCSFWMLTHALLTFVIAKEKLPSTCRLIFGEVVLGWCK